MRQTGIKASSTFLTKTTRGQSYHSPRLQEEDDWVGTTEFCSGRVKFERSFSINNPSDGNVEQVVEYLVLEFRGELRAPFGNTSSSTVR